MNIVKEENKEHAFQEIGNFSETFINSRALACWTHWEATGDLPKGDYIAAFKGWLYNGLHSKKIKETSGNPQQNAYVERYNRTVRYDWLNQYIFTTIEEVQKNATNWLWTYNNERPNMAIGGITPKQKLAMELVSIAA